jgi:hypothetical protein
MNMDDEKVAGKIRGRDQILLMCLLVLLNFIIRYPVTPHELGSDSYFIHMLANSIITFEHARWAINPLSYFGLFAYSYPSGTPFLLAVGSSISGVDMEWTIYVISSVWGLTGLFSIFVLAGEFNNTFLFKYLTAFVFSIAPLTLKFTLWTVSARGLFIMILPLFLWCMIRTFKTRRLGYAILTIMLFLLSASVHKMFVLIIPLFLAYLSATSISKLTNKNIRFIDKPYLLISSLTILFFAQFFIYRSWWTYANSPFRGTEWYDLVLALAIELIMRLGLMLPLSLVGLSIVFFNKEKNVKSWFLIISLLLFTPLLSHSMYFYQTLLPLFSILAVIGITRIYDVFYRRFHPSYSLVVILTTVLAFSLLTLNVRNMNTDSPGYGNYMLPLTSSLSEFIENNTENEAISGGDWNRMSAYISNPTPASAGPEYFIYGALNEKGESIVRNPLPKSFEDIPSFLRRPFAIITPPQKFRETYLVTPKTDINETASSILIYSNKLENLVILPSI